MAQSRRGPKSWAAVMLVAGLSLAGLAPEPAAGAAGSGAPDPGRSTGCDTSAVGAGTETVAVSSGGTDRSYIRHVPPAHDGATALPLVLAFHGWAEGSILHQQTTEYIPRADEDGFIAVFPQGLGAPAAWNFSLTSPDLTFVGDLLDHLESTLCIDTSRIFVSGFSNGAFLASSIACVYADRVAAIAPVAGLRDPAGCVPSRPVPVLSFHGTVDNWVPFGPIPANAAAWADRNGCGSPPTEQPAGQDEVVDITLVRYPCGDDAAVELYRIDGGGHAWPGSAFSRAIAPYVGYTTFEISATDLILDFFENHPMPTEEEPPPTTGTFRALTYNVAGLPAVLSGSEPDINTPYISPLLNAYDLVLVQEDWANPDPPIAGVSVYHDLLISEVTHPYLSEPAPLPLGTNPRRPTALVSDGLNRISRFPFGEITRVMWPNCFGGADTSDGGAGDCLSEKGFSVARTELAPGVEVDVYNLHAEAGSTPSDVQFSAEDFEVLADFIVEHSAGRAVIVGGDFNLHTDEAVDGAVHTAFLAATGLTDVCQVVSCGADQHEIDKFAFRGGSGVRLEALTHRFERDVFVRPTDGAPLSDHSALAVTFAWSLEPLAPGSIRGTVTGPDGPVAGATVWAYRPTDTWVGTTATVTGPDGSYRLEGLPARGYAIAFVPPPSTGLLAEWHRDATRHDATPVTVTAAGVTPGIDAVLQEGGSITGNVVGSGGPVAGATVWAYGPSDTWVGSAVTSTAADGSYRLTGLPSGDHRILFVAPTAARVIRQWFEGSRLRATAQAVTVTAGSVVSGVDADLAAAL